MRNYAKTGKKPGKPAYRTPSAFITRQKQNVKKFKAQQKYADQSKGAFVGKKTNHQQKGRK